LIFKKFPAKYFTFENSPSLEGLFSKVKYFAETKNNNFFLQGLKPKRGIFAGTKTIF